MEFWIYYKKRTQSSFYLKFTRLFSKKHCLCERSVFILKMLSLLTGIGNYFFDVNDILHEYISKEKIQIHFHPPVFEWVVNKVFMFLNPLSDIPIDRSNFNRKHLEFLNYFSTDICILCFKGTSDEVIKNHITV